MVKLLSIDCDLFGEESAVVLRIHDIADDPRSVFVLFLVAVSHLFSHRFASEEGLEARDYREVDESLSRFSCSVVARLSAVGTGSL